MDELKSALVVDQNMWDSNIFQLTAFERKTTLPKNFVDAEGIVKTF